MEQRFLLDSSISFIRDVSLTPIVALYFTLGFIFFLAIYHWSEAAEKIENLSSGKKFILFIFLAAFFGFVYYIIYKAGKFDAILNQIVRIKNAR